MTAVCPLNFDIGKFFKIPDITFQPKQLFWNILPSSNSCANIKVYRTTRNFTPAKMIRLFEGKEHIALYQKYRTRTPELVTTEILNYMAKVSGQRPPYGIAVDVGSGTGQHTLVLAPHFSKVRGYDISSAQIEAASHDPAKPANVSYHVSRAEALTDLADGSVDLLTGCQAFHWMDLPEFYREVDRVLRPGGTVAAVGHAQSLSISHPTKSAPLERLADNFIATNLRPRYHEKLAFLDTEYRDLPMPYPNEVRLNGLIEEMTQTVSYLTGYYSTWLSFQSLYEEDPQRAITLLEDFQDNFLKTMDASTSAEETPLMLRNHFFLVMCRKQISTAGH